jgi:hypothetical protein
MTGSGARLAEASLLEAACKNTGLSDFGDDRFREGFRVFIKSVEEEAGLSELGYVIVQARIADYLSNRLQMTDWHKHHPEIAEGEIRRPIFIVGMGRTGTTILHDLLAQDPANRTPLTWEVARPCPPPERETYETDPRIDETDAQLAMADQLAPELKKMHPMGARLPQECGAMRFHDFASMSLHNMYRVPSYSNWLHNELDLAWVYASHRLQLQLLQWRCPGERWVLKSPQHLWTLEALLAEYPDACLIQTHRDPVAITASLSSISAMLRSMTSDHVDIREVAREWAHHIPIALERSMGARESGAIDPEQVIDIQFRDFMADPFGMIREIYDHFGLEYSAEAEARMRDHLAENPAGKHGKHVYRFADTGLDLAEEREKVRRYQEYFGVPVEDLA